MTDAELQELCQKWQRVLRLQDWRINVKFVDTEHMADDALASCTPFSDAKLAIIKVSRPDAVDKSGLFAAAFPEHYDSERLLLHELLHIPLHEIFDTDADKQLGILQEQAIESIADALIALDRG